jgi:selenocysteine lyase/cysteine desulfurase
VLRRSTYLNTGSFGPLPSATVAAMQAVERSELEEGRSSRGYFQRVLDEREVLRAELAGLLGTRPDRIALTSSTTEGCNIVLRGLGIGPGDEVVTTDSEHLDSSVDLSPLARRFAWQRFASVLPPRSSRRSRLRSRLGRASSLFPTSRG